MLRAQALHCQSNKTLTISIQLKHTVQYRTLAFVVEGSLKHEARQNIVDREMFNEKSHSLILNAATRSVLRLNMYSSYVAIILKSQKV